MKWIASVLGALLFCLAIGVQQPAEETPAGQSADLASYLKAHWMPPEDYVVSKFKDHDIVFIGEWHRIKHDPELIQALIPLLYKAGIHNLGIEFGDYEYQDKADKLVTANTYDEELARWLMFKQWAFWGYKEYVDLYHAAWALNKSFPKDAPKFRVVGLDYTPNWKLMTVPKEQLTDEQRKKVFYNGDGDEYMASVVLKEFVAKGQKALIYSGNHHAFTHYQQPYYDFEKKKLIRLTDNRMGNLVYAKIGTRAFNVLLHCPWPAIDSFEKMACPVGGAIDAVMAGFTDKRVGFDVAGTPFGQLRDPGTYYAIGHEDFKLEDFCDGYIYQKPFKDYEGVTTDPLFVTKKNFQEALDDVVNFQARKYYKKPEDILEAIKRDADIPRRFRSYSLCAYP